MPHSGNFKEVHKNFFSLLLKLIYTYWNTETFIKLIILSKFFRNNLFLEGMGRCITLI